MKTDKSYKKKAKKKTRTIKKKAMNEDGWILHPKYKERGAVFFHRKLTQWSKKSGNYVPAKLTYTL